MKYRSQAPTVNGDDVFKSGEERAADRRERETARAEQARAAEERRKQEAFLATPVGAATAAKEAGQQFFEIQLQVGSHIGTAGFGSTDGQRSMSSSAAILGEIESVGWRLEHAGYFYMITSETSSDRMFLSGQATAVSGVTIGVYLFRTTTPTSGGEPAPAL
jgi:hypothetical protein